MIRNLFHFAFLIPVILLYHSKSHAQGTPLRDTTVYVFVQVIPEFPGGEEAFMNYLQENIRYPEEAKKKKIEGRVIAEFIVEPDGSITNVTIKRGIGGGCDEEVLRVLRNMPRWKPGMQHGRPVRVRYTLPVGFFLK